MHNSSELELVSITKKYGNTVAVDTISYRFGPRCLRLLIGSIWVWKIIYPSNDRWARGRDGRFYCVVWS